MCLLMQLHYFKNFLLYFLLLFSSTTFFRLWNAWEEVLAGEAVDWPAAFADLDLGRIFTITLPIAIGVAYSVTKRQSACKA